MNASISDYLFAYINSPHNNQLCGKFGARCRSSKQVHTGRENRGIVRPCVGARSNLGINDTVDDMTGCGDQLYYQRRGVLRDKGAGALSG